MIEWLEMPGFEGSVANGLAPDGTVVGVVQETSGRVRGFVMGPDRRQFRLVDAPRATDTFLQDVSAGGLVLGDATDGERSWAFILLGGIFQPVQPPGAAETWAGGLLANGDCCGCVRDAGGRRVGFRRTGARFSEVLPAGAESAVLHGMGDGGEIVGACSLGGQATGFLVRRDGSTEWLEHPRGEFVPADCALGGTWVVGSLAGRDGRTTAAELRDGTWREIELPGGPWHASAAVGVTPGVGVAGWVQGADGRKCGFVLQVPS